MWTIEKQEGRRRILRVSLCLIHHFFSLSSHTLSINFRCSSPLCLSLSLRMFSQHFRLLGRTLVVAANTFQSSTTNRTTSFLTKSRTHRIGPKQRILSTQLLERRTMSTTTNGKSSLNGHRKHSLESIRAHLRKSDTPDCNGKLKLELDSKTGLATLCIDSPQRKNAFSGTMMAQFSDILTQLETWNEVSTPSFFSFN